MIEIENEAPDIVRAQLPVELRTLGATVQYGTSESENQVFLTDAFDTPNDEPSTAYTSANDTLYYEASRNSTGFRDW